MIDNIASNDPCGRLHVTRAQNGACPPIPIPCDWRLKKKGLAQIIYIPS